MKKEYQKPIVEFEVYTMDEAIAANCGNVITLGPGDFTGYVCEDYTGDMDVVSYSLRSTGTSFYDGVTGPTCDCYYSSGGQGYFTS